MLLNLKRKIIAQFRSQSNFAQTVGVDDSKLSRIINGRRVLSDQEKIRWARLLDADAEELFERVPQH
jgi:plasmid maintenance system antidote protein VapI